MIKYRSKLFAKTAQNSNSSVIIRSIDTPLGVFKYGKKFPQSYCWAQSQIQGNIE